MNPREHLFTVIRWGNDFCDKHFEGEYKNTVKDWLRYYCVSTYNQRIRDTLPLQITGN